jgi:excisionase family DNA binding protein
MGEENLPPIMTIAQVSEHIGLQELTVRRLAREGKIPALKLGRQWRIKRDLLDAWIKGHPVGSLGARGQRE